MFFAVRLLRYNPKKGHKMRTYVSATSGSRYKAGEWMTPSTWRVVKLANELEELNAIPQFEIRKFETLKDLQKVVQLEMEELARRGFPAVGAHIDLKTVKKAKERAPVRDLSVLEPPDLPDDSPEFDEDAAEDDLPRTEESDENFEVDEPPTSTDDSDIPMGPSGTGGVRRDRKKKSTKKKSKSKR
jgi:hypothetical protein